MIFMTQYLNQFNILFSGTLVQAPGDMAYSPFSIYDVERNPSMAEKRKGKGIRNQELGSHLTMTNYRNVGKFSTSLNSVNIKCDNVSNIWKIPQQCIHLAPPSFLSSCWFQPISSFLFFFLHNSRHMINISAAIEWRSWKTNNFLLTIFFSLMASLECNT